PDPGRHRRRGAAGRAARRERRRAGVARAAMQQIAREPAQRERRRVAAAENDRAGAQQIVDHRAVGLRHQVLLQPRPVAGREPGLIDIDLGRHRNAGQGTRVLAAGDHPVDRVGPLPHQLGPVGDQRIEPGIDGVEALKRGLRGLAGGRLARADEVGKLGCGKTPEFGHSATIRVRRDACGVAPCPNMHVWCKAVAYLIRYWQIHTPSHRKRRARFNSLDMADRTDTANVVIRPPIAWVVAVLVGLALDSLMPWWFVPSAPCPPWLGALVFGLALALIGWAIAPVTRAGSNVPTNRPTTTIVDTGPYRLTRNPISLGMVLGLIGLAIAFNSLWLLL